MSRLDVALKIVWMIIGIFMLSWLSLVRVPEEWRRWEARRERDRRPPPVEREPGVIVGERASQDREQRIRRHGIRFSTPIDPAYRAATTAGSTRSLGGDDWLLIPVNLETFRRPSVAPPPPMVREHDPRADYTWRSGMIADDYIHVQLSAVNVVFYRRDGSENRLLMDRPAWIQAVLLPAEPGARYYYEMATADTDGNGRIDRNDDIALWSSEPDGTDLHLVWMPSGIIQPTRYREPMTGDLFCTVVSDTDGDGEITEYDRHSLFRIAVGDTVARAVVFENTIQQIESIVFGDEPGSDH